MGDVAMAAAVMREIAEQNPNTHFVFATRSFFEPFFANIENLTVFSADFNNKHKGLKGLFLLFQEINKQYSIDAIADLHYVLRSKILCLFFQLFGKRKTKISHIQKDRKAKQELCKTKHKKFEQLKPTWQRYADVFQQLNLASKLQNNPILFVSEKVKRLGISPFAKHQGKIYPLDLMEKAVEQLSQKFEVFLFGGGCNEKQVCEEWQNKFPNVISTLGKYSLSEELTFISTLDAMLSMDSSGMHIATLCEIPCVSVWGATHPFAGFVGYRQSQNPFIQIDLPCRPCSVFGDKPCRFKDYRCLYRISPEQITAIF